jgi:hypothetical protein
MGFVHFAEWRFTGVIAAQILAQQRFDDAVPEILVTVFSFTWPGAVGR